MLRFLSNVFDLPGLAQFGAGAIPQQHGFARTREWILESHSAPDESSPTIQVILSLKDDSQTRVLWNNQFRLEYTVTLSDKALSLKLAVENLNSLPQPFSFTSALHTYFRVEHIGRTEIEGLGRREFIDKLAGMEHSKESRAVVRISEETDRVYGPCKDGNGDVELRAASGGDRISISSRAFTDIGKLSINEVRTFDVYTTSSAMESMGGKGSLFG